VLNEQQVGGRVDSKGRQTAMDGSAAGGKGADEPVWRSGGWRGGAWAEMVRERRTLYGSVRRTGLGENTSQLTNPRLHPEHSDTREAGWSLQITHMCHRTKITLLLSSSK